MKVIVSIAICCLWSCNNRVTTDFPKIATLPIDTASYPTIKDKFSLESLYRAPDYLGGLSPNYPIAYGFVDCADCYEQSWMGEGLMCSCKQIIIEKGKFYVLIRSKEELKAFYSPITTSHEALSYAALVSDAFPVLNNSFFKEVYRYKRKVSTSRVQKLDGYYIVQLYSHKIFGCSHPYSVVLLKVETDGEVTILRQEDAFSNPSEDALCVD